MEDMDYITLKCTQCENTNCSIHNIKYLHPLSQTGCRRYLSDEQFVKYQHITQEIEPFMYMDTSKLYQDKTYKQIIALMDEIYSCPAKPIVDTKYYL